MRVLPLLQPGIVLIKSSGHCVFHCMRLQWGDAFLARHSRAMSGTSHTTNVSPLERHGSGAIPAIGATAGSLGLRDKSAAMI
jgi:hypothetical protein